MCIYLSRCFNQCPPFQDDSSIPVKQFQYTGWPEEGVPDVGSGLIDVIGQVQKWQRSSGDRPIVVHCRLVCYTVIQGELSP